MNDNKQLPNAWGQNKNVPDSWGKSNDLPENWGKQRSNAANGSPFGGTRTTSSANAEKTKNLSDKARSGAGRLAGAAKKVGGAAKNAAGNVVDHAKSDYAAKKVVLPEGSAGEAFVVPNEKAFENDETNSPVADISNVENAIVPETDVSEDECLSAIEDDGYSESADTEDYLDQQESVSPDTTGSIVNSYLLKITNEELAENIRGAKTAIEIGQWRIAADYCESTIEVDDSSPIPFLFLLLCNNKLGSINELGELPLKKGLMSLEDYRKAFTNADDELRELLNEMNMQSIYSYSAMVVSKDSDRKERLLELISAYRNLYSFMRSNELSDELKQKASGYLYDISCSALSFAKRYSEYSQVSQMFKQIGHYEDSAELSKKCFDSFKQSVQETLASDDATISELEAVYQDLEKAKDMSGLDKLKRECLDKLDTARLRGENDYYNKRYEESLEKSKKTKRGLGIAAGVVILLLGIKFAIAGIAFLKGDEKPSRENISSSEQNTSNSKTLLSNANYALEELDEAGYDFSGRHIICSDSSLNYSISPQKPDYDTFISYLKYYSDDIDSFEWFIVVNEGVATYAAVSDVWQSTTSQPDLLTRYGEEKMALMEIPIETTLASEVSGDVMEAVTTTAKKKTENKTTVRITTVSLTTNTVTTSENENNEQTTVQLQLKETYAFYGVVSTEEGTLNLRDKPSTDSNVIKELPKGTKGSIYYIDGYSDWYKMYTDDGQIGFVSAQYIKEYIENNNIDVSTNKSTQVKADGSSVDPSGIKFYLKNDTPIEFSDYSDGVLISTVRVDKVEYEIINIAPSSKRNDSDFGKFYVKLSFYLTKTYDRYSNEDRYSMNPHLYFKITNLSTGKSICSKSCDGKATASINATYSKLEREGDTAIDEWYSREDLFDEYGNGIQVYRDNEYMITIMDISEMYNS